jgi:hypothetical protein
MPVTALGLPADAAPLAEQRALVARQLDLMIEDRGCVTQVRRLLDDLDRISADLAATLRAAETGRRRD